MMKHRKIHHHQEGAMKVLKLRTVLKSLRNHSLFLIKKLLPGTIFALLCLYFYPISLTSPRTELHTSSHIITCISSISSVSPPLPFTEHEPELLPVSNQITNNNFSDSGSGSGSGSGFPHEPDISLTPSLPTVIVLPHSSSNNITNSSDSSIDSSLTLSPPPVIVLPHSGSNNITNYSSSTASDSPTEPSPTLSPTPVILLPDSSNISNYSSISESPPLFITISPPTELTDITTNNSFLPTSPDSEGVILTEKDEDIPPPPPSFSVKDKVYEKQCDYFNGKWVRDKRGPLYNGSCGVIKDGHNCMANGRPDSDYLYWKWKPRRCHLPRFDPEAFLQLIRNKHVSFVGDSLARNQLESLVCMLSTVSTPKFVFRGIGWWHFPSHNATLSSYWAPFLVQGVQRQLTGPGPRHNTMHLDQVNENWAVDIDKMDFIVLAFGHWFAEIPSVYYEGGSVLGCQKFNGPNCTEISHYIPIRKALRTALNSIIDRKARKENEVGVIVRTFSPVHFEGSWDKGGTCSKLSPYRGKRKLGKNDAEIRRIGMEEMQKAKVKAKYFGRLFKFKALDVTKLALMRPDGHPGAYRSPNPFAKGVPKNVQNDCTHWCLPGPIDTWNEIFMEMVRKWEQ